jgi:Fic family protein
VERKKWINEDGLVENSEENSLIPSEELATHLQFLVSSIEEQRKIIDRNLTRPAKWQGLARREFEGRDAPDVRKRVEIAYNNLIDKAMKKVPLDLALLLTVHKDLVDGGGQFRLKGVRVGKKDPIQRPHSSTVPSLVERALARAEDGVEPPPLAATRLHLELLIIHPFSDSNGRVARLMASYILMRAGYYSTLLSAVEQHFQVQPRAYARTFRILRSGKEKDHAPWIITALEAMLFNSMKASWFRTRQDDLLKALKKAEIPQNRWTQTALDYDLSRRTQEATKLAETLGDSISPILEHAKGMQRGELRALVTQVERLSAEEMIERDESDEYTMQVLGALKELLQVPSNRAHA